MQRAPAAVRRRNKGQAMQRSKIHHEILPIPSVTAIILGGGRGTRLFPLTAERAKPAVPLCGRYRLVDIPISNCIHSGMKRIFVLTQFNSGSLNSHISNTYKFDNFSGGFVEILAAEQTDAEGNDWFQGTADAVRKQIRHITSHHAEHYIILAGDHLYRMDYRTLLKTHIERDADITVATLPVQRAECASFGVMKIANNERIQEFVEKPKDRAVLDDLQAPQAVLDRYGIGVREKRAYLASMGVYAMKAKVLHEILKKHPEWMDFGQHIIPRSLKTKRVFSHPFLGYWEDIGTVRSYYEVSISLTIPDPPFVFHDPTYTVYSRARYLPGSRMRDMQLHNTIVCEGCRLGSGSIADSIVGIRTIARGEVHIERSIIMGADFYEEEPDAQYPIGIGAGTRIREAIVDKNARIGKNVTITGSKRLRDCNGEGYVVRDGIVIVPKNAIIPDGTKIG